MSKITSAESMTISGFSPIGLLELTTRDLTGPKATFGPMPVTMPPVLVSYGDFALHSELEVSSSELLTCTLGS